MNQLEAMRLKSLPRGSIYKIVGCCCLNICFRSGFILLITLTYACTIDIPLKTRVIVLYCIFYKILGWCCLNTCFRSGFSLLITLTYACAVNIPLKTRVIVLYFIWWGGHCCPIHCDIFKIYCDPPNLGIRTWICQLNLAQMPIFSGLRFFNELEISGSWPLS